MIGFDKIDMTMHGCIPVEIIIVSDSSHLANSDIHQTSPEEQKLGIIDRRIEPLLAALPPSRDGRQLQDLVSIAGLLCCCVVVWSQSQITAALALPLSCCL